MSDISFPLDRFIYALETISVNVRFIFIQSEHAVCSAY